MSSSDDAFADFVRERSPELLRSAWLLVGDWHLAHDLVQTSLEKCWPRWGRDIAHPEAYVRRVMLTTFLSWRRRRWTAELPTDDLPDRPTGAEPPDLGIELREVLRDLTPRQRAVLVLRYFEDLGEAETAELLGCSVGTVKAHASRGLQRLRETPGLAGAMGVRSSDD